VMFVLVGAPRGEHSGAELQPLFAEGFLLAKPVGVAAEVALQM